MKTSSSNSLIFLLPYLPGHWLNHLDTPQRAPFGPWQLHLYVHFRAEGNQIESGWDRLLRLLWWSVLSKMSEMDGWKNRSLALRCVSVLSASCVSVAWTLWLYRSLYISSGRLHHIPISEHQQMLTFYTMNWKIPVLFCFVFFWNQWWPERMLCCAFGNCINLYYQEPRKI